MHQCFFDFSCFKVVWEKLGDTSLFYSGVLASNELSLFLLHMRRGSGADTGHEMQYDNGGKHDECQNRNKNQISTYIGIMF
ncbi:MAG: hypothetical protein NVS4B7_08170 [Ktedonobacteraceae bacterium]